MTEIERSRKAVEELAACVCVDRHETYGTVSENFGRVAALASAALGHPFTASDVAVFMACVKLARIKNNPSFRDNWIDLAGYGICGVTLLEHPDEKADKEAAPSVGTTRRNAQRVDIPGERLIRPETPENLAKAEKAIDAARQTSRARVSVERSVPSR